MESLRFRSWKDFSLGWWNALASAWFPDVRHFENLTPWIQLRLGFRDRAWKPTNGHSRKLAQLSMTIFSKFWSRDHYPICIHGSRSRCFTCIAEQATSEVVDMFSRGGRDCHFANTSVEMAKFVRAAVQLLSRVPTPFGWWNSWTFPGLFQDLILFFKDPPGLKQQLTRINILSQVTDFHCCYINRANNDSMALTKKY